MTQNIKDIRIGEALSYAQEDAQNNVSSPIIVQKVPYDENNIGDIEENMDQVNTTTVAVLENFDSVENFDSLCIPHNVDELFKNFDSNQSHIFQDVNQLPVDASQYSVDVNQLSADVKKLPVDASQLPAKVNQLNTKVSTHQLLAQSMDIGSIMNDEDILAWNTMCPRDMTSHYEINEASNFGTIVLSNKVMAHLDNNSQNGLFLDNEHQERMSNILAHALEPGAYGDFSNCSTETNMLMGKTHQGKRKSCSVLFSYDLQAYDNRVEDYLEQILLPADAFTFTDADITTHINSVDYSCQKKVEDSRENIVAKVMKNLLDSDMKNIVADVHFVHIDQMLQTPDTRKNATGNITRSLGLPFLERKSAVSRTLPADVNVLASAENYVSASAENYVSASAEINTETTLQAHAEVKAEPFFWQENIITTDFFSLYDEKEKTRDTIMWDTSDFSDVYGIASFDEDMDCWADFDIEKDWIDLSFYSGREYSFEVINKNNASTVVIKDAHGTIIQKLTIQNSDVDYVLVQCMQEHIQNPASDDILSLGKRFGIFAVDSIEPWFSQFYERPNAIEFLILQEKLQEVLGEYELKFQGKI